MVDMKPSALAAIAALALLAGSTSAYQSQSTVAVDKPFPKAGTIKMTLAAGDYRISGRPDERIRVSWRADRADQGRNVRADAEIRGNTAVRDPFEPIDAGGSECGLDDPRSGGISFGHGRKSTTDRS